MKKKPLSFDGIMRHVDRLADQVVCLWDRSLETDDFREHRKIEELKDMIAWRQELLWSLLDQRNMDENEDGPDSFSPDCYGALQNR